MLAHFFRRALWLISVSTQLIAAMGVGVKWVIMSIRLICFALLGLVYFIPQVWWYMFAPNVIRRVAYRSSSQTKRRNIEIFLRNIVRAHPGLLSAENNVREKSGGEKLRLPYNINTDLVDPNTVELLASTLNPADGCVMSALPINEHLDDLQGQLSKSPSFTHAMELTQRYYATYQNSSKALPGEVQNLVNASMHGDSSSIGSDDEDDEDRENLHNRATLDIYLPVPLDSLFRMMEQEKTMASRHKLHRKKFPIVITVNGGAWIIGSYFWNFLLARLLSARGYVVFCPDYRNFPQTNMEGMVLDVSDAIGWVLKNAGRYNGDLDDVTLMGQSAGAHLTMMSLLSQAQLHAHSAEGGGGAANPPSAVAYNVQRYNPRESIHRYIGLSGIYNVRGLVKHFDRRGLYRSVLQKIAGGRVNLPRYSLNSYFDEKRRGETGETLPENIFDFLPKRMFFIHGDADCSAPASESANIAYLMRNAQHARLAEQYTRSNQETKTPRVSPVIIEYIVVPGANHTDAIIEEPLCSNTSHIVEFLSCYDIGGRKCCEYHAAVSYRVCGGVPFIEYTVDDEEDRIVPSRSPDGKLFTTAPHCKRPLIIRAASAICPF